MEVVRISGWIGHGSKKQLNMACNVCDCDECVPDCPVAQWDRGLDAETILRFNMDQGGHALIMADPPYFAKRLGDGLCELRVDRAHVGCEGNGEMYSWTGQNPYTLRFRTWRVCNNCCFQLELVRNNIEEIDN